MFIPFCFDVAILSRMRSAMISRSYCANVIRVFSIMRPADVLVLMSCVTEMKSTPLRERLF